MGCLRNDRTGLLQHRGTHGVGAAQIGGRIRQRLQFSVRKHLYYRWNFRQDGFERDISLYRCAAGLVHQVVRLQATEPRRKRHHEAFAQHDAPRAVQVAPHAAREYLQILQQQDGQVQASLGCDERGPDHLQLEQAVISMLAGDVFDNRGVRWRLRVFRVVYALTALGMAPRALAGWLRRRRQVGEGFSGDTLQGGNP